jgi:hypothetical protein
LERWLRDLDHERSDVREQASAELTRRGEPALPAARKALQEQPSAEVRRRLREIIEGLVGSMSPPDARGALRAIEALEHAGTAEARAVLKELAAGLAEARLTREANGALGRLAKPGSAR